MPSDSANVRLKNSRRPWLIGMIAGILVLTALAFAFWPKKPVEINQVPSPSPNQDDDLVVLPVENPGYVGSAACAECHSARYEHFKQSRHFWACTTPDDRPMPAAFNSGKVMNSSDPAIRFEMTRENGQFVQKTMQTSPQGVKTTTTPIGMVYGHGGHFDEVYFAWKGNRLFELPVTWLHPTNEWANVLLDPHQSGDFSRVTTTRCVECHATWLGHVPGTPNEYHRDSAIFGVGCERCHGPAKDHISFHKANPQTKGKHAIVHPAELSRNQRIDLCAQCHSNAAFPADLPFTHRPGEPLDKSYKTLVSRFPEDDHVANQTKYMKESKCFQKSEMTCLTCHDPHKPTDHKKVADGCLKCHQPANCKEQPKLPLAVQNNCTGCHLPARVWINVHFHTEKDSYVPPIRRYQHRIAVYPEATQEVLLAWQKSRPNGEGNAEAKSLTKSLVSHWLGEADQYRKEYRFYSEMRAIREALFFDPSPEIKSRLTDAIGRQSKHDHLFGDGLHLMEQKRYPDALKQFSAMLEINPRSPKAHSRLGTVNAMLSKNDIAERHLRIAAQEDPNDPYAYNMLGWIAYLQNRSADAIPEFLNALKIDPANDALLYRLGLAYLSREMLPEGRKTFERLYLLNPNHAGGCQGLSHILRKQGEYSEAIKYARRAVKLSEARQADMLLSLSDAYADAGRKAEAMENLEQAIQVAENPAFRNQLEQRLQTLREGAFSNFGR